MKNRANVGARSICLIPILALIAFGANAQNTLPATGNVGIGTTAPGQTLAVSGNVGIVNINSQRQFTYGAVGDGNTDLWFQSNSSFANNGAFAGIYLARQNYQFAGSGNDLNDLVGLHINGFYSNSGAQLPIYLGGYSWNSQVPAVTINQSGNVGVGATKPGARLEVWGGQEGQLGPVTALKIDGPNSPTNSNSAQDLAWSFAAAGSAKIRAYRGWSMGTYLQFLTNPEGTGPDDPQIRMTLDQSGNVGIGTTSPGQKLEVAGNVKLSGTGASIYFPDGSIQSTAYNGVTCGGDYAESVDVSGERTKYGPGDVLVIDPDVSGKFLKSAEPYSTFVTGIYSTKPGTVGRRQAGSQRPEEVPMAMIGIVPTKVTAENGPIHRGDLLVSSSTIGYAMKGTDRGRLTGAVIGKALDNLESGQGVIEVVVTLQ